MTNEIHEGRILEELLDDISVFLGDMKAIKNIIRYYWEAGLYSEQLIRMLLVEERCQLPIDIELLANKLGVEVKDADLNCYQDLDQELDILNKRIGQLVLRKNSYTNMVEKIIYTESMVPLSSKRFAVAHELSHYLLYRTKTLSRDRYESYFIMPMIPLNMEELMIDIFSIFLLIPVSQFFEEFKQFVKHSRNTQRVPVATEDWLRYLSEKAVLPEFYTACGYQYLRNVGYWIYMGKNGDKGEIQRINMTQANQKEIQKNTEYFDEDILRLLYQ